MAKGQRINNDLQNNTQKAKNPTTRTPLKQGLSSGRVGGTCSTCETRHVTLVTSCLYYVPCCITDCTAYYFLELTLPHTIYCN